MAVYDLEEQEQLATLKAWWNDNGNLVLTALSLVLIVFAAWQAWNYYQRNQAAQASALYDAVQKAAGANDLKQVRESAGAILEQYPRTTYAAMAALVSAKAHFQGGDLKTAHAQLAWVAENARDEALQDIARLHSAAPRCAGNGEMRLVFAFVSALAAMLLVAACGGGSMVSSAIESMNPMNWFGSRSPAP